MPIRREKGSGAPSAAYDLESLTVKGRIPADGVDLNGKESSCEIRTGSPKTRPTRS